MIQVGFKLKKLISCSSGRRTVKGPFLNGCFIQGNPPRIVKHFVNLSGLLIRCVDGRLAAALQTFVHQNGCLHGSPLNRSLRTTNTKFRPPKSSRTVSDSLSISHFTLAWCIRLATLGGPLYCRIPFDLPNILWASCHPASHQRSPQVPKAIPRQYIDTKWVFTRIHGAWEHIPDRFPFHSINIGCTHGLYGFGRVIFSEALNRYLNSIQVVFTALAEPGFSIPTPCQISVCWIPRPWTGLLKHFLLSSPSEHLIPALSPLTTIPGPMYIWEMALFRAHTYSETVPYPWDLEHRRISMHSARFSLSTARLFLRPISDSLVACNELMAAESLFGHLTDDSFCRNFFGQCHCLWGTPCSLSAPAPFKRAFSHKQLILLFFFGSSLFLETMTIIFGKRWPLFLQHEYSRLILHRPKDQYKRDSLKPWNHQDIRVILRNPIPSQTTMAFARLSAIIALALGASQLASAAVVKRSTTCPTGQTTANAACCCSYYSNPGEK